ncbi:hypothetical protein BDB01DRAFT_840117 [Pilobolus umbonatus]|nr:hypothetical protein BDB01DRAFT_840117 [Pilobolus umbonatus]
MTHDASGITVSLHEAKRLEAQDEQRLIRSRKLSLIVDLDQTVLHATWEPSIAQWGNERKKHDTDIRQFTLEGRPIVYTIKFRPGLFDFLQKMAELYEMHIYTMGTRSYAEAVVKELDPEGTYFEDRILSRDESGSMTEKRLERLFPSDTSKVVIIDDRADVWNYSPNLIHIKAYEFFVGIGDINSPFAPPKKDLIPATFNTTPTTSISDVSVAAVMNKDDLIDSDNILPIITKTLTTIHHDYYEQLEQKPDQKPNVATIIPAIKHNIFKGVHIVFSGVIPLNNKPESSWVWRMATSLGAVCGTELTGKVTHLVAATDGTSKVNAAKKYPHIKIVTTSWITESAWRWERQSEQQHALSLSAGSEVGNPESVPLDFDEDPLIKLEWDSEGDKEVEDLLKESDWESDLDDEINDLLDEVIEEEEEADTLKKRKREEEGEEQRKEVKVDTDTDSEDYFELHDDDGENEVEDYGEEEEEEEEEDRSPTDFLSTVLGQTVRVRLNSGIDYKGTLACLDGYMNIALENTEEYVEGRLVNKYGDTFVRGNNGVGNLDTL